MAFNLTAFLILRGQDRTRVATKSAERGLRRLGTQAVSLNTQLKSLGAVYASSLAGRRFPRTCGDRPSPARAAMYKGMVPPHVRG